MKLQEKIVCQVQDLGLIDYELAYREQKKNVDDVLAGGHQRLLLCEHPSVLTLGRLADERHILVSREILKNKGILVHFIDRGGDITLHAPGQLVVYPIFNLADQGKDLHTYMHRLEQVAIDLLEGFGIVANRFSGNTGVWIGDQKIASIGIGVRKWISYHGLAININTDLDLFSLIQPCGLDVGMTSLSNLMGGTIIDMGQVKDKIVECFNRNFNLL